jgi:lysophospholipase L1-like esterase
MRRQKVFLAITLLFPFILLALVEGALRLGGYGGNRAAFEAPPHLRGEYLAPSRNLGRRYFTRERQPPSPPTDAFLADKPENALRIFVLGESSAAGFPYPPNGTFSRLLRDALRDVLPHDTVEVVNIGLAATNSYTIADLARDVIAQQPDAVLIYAGHNEYYGALGAGSTETLGNSPALVRMVLRLQRIRLVLLMRNAIAAVGSALGGDERGGGDDDTGAGQAGELSASRMESVVRDQRIVLGDATYERGVTQFAGNLDAILERFRRAGVPVFLASLPGNIRSQPPFGSADDSLHPRADSTFAAAQRALESGDTAQARDLFSRARDLDVVRFRAPSAFDSVIVRAAASGGARYVPVREAFEHHSPGGIPGEELFLEHVHPNQQGYAIIGRIFYEAVAEDGFLGRRADVSGLAPWNEYTDRMELTELDHRAAAHTVNTIKARWPFVPLDAQVDYRSSYRPSGMVDSLAFDISRGGPWDRAKAQLGQHYESNDEYALAFAEYRGLIRELPHAGMPYQLAGRALIGMGESARAINTLRLGHSIEPSAESAFLLGKLELRGGNPPLAIQYFQEALAERPRDPDVLYQMLLAAGAMRDDRRARAAATELVRVAPEYPGLAQWLAALGLRRP